MKLHAIRDQTKWERALFSRLTETPFPGSDVIQRQSHDCQVGEIDGEGSLKIHTRVQDSALVKFRVPVEAFGKDSDGMYVHFLLHVLDGKAVELEIYKDGSSPIESMPLVENLELIVYPIKG